MLDYSNILVNTRAPKPEDLFHNITTSSFQINALRAFSTRARQALQDTDRNAVRPPERKDFNFVENTQKNTITPQ